MRADPIFGALSAMESALRQAEAELRRAEKQGDETLSDWLDNFISTTRVWLDRWHEVVREANRPELGARP